MHGLSGALALARQEAATVTLRAEAAESQRTAEALEASQAALTAAETASAALRLEAGLATRGGPPDDRPAGRCDHCR